MTKIEEVIIHEVEDEVKPKPEGPPLECNQTCTKNSYHYCAALLCIQQNTDKPGTNPLEHANYWWMLAGVIFYFASMIASSWRLLSFFKSINLRLNPMFNFRLYLLGIFYNFYCQVVSEVTAIKYTC